MGIPKEMTRKLQNSTCRKVFSIYLPIYISIIQIKVLLFAYAGYVSSVFALNHLKIPELNDIPVVQRREYETQERLNNGNHKSQNGLGSFCVCVTQRKDENVFDVLYFNVALFANNSVFSCSGSHDLQVQTVR